MRFALRQVGSRWLALPVLLMWLAATASATTVRIPADDDLIIGARAIVRGRVLAVACDFDAQGRIYTYVTLRVNEVLKGRITSRRIVLKEPGGQVGPQGSLIFGAPRFKPDEEVVVHVSDKTRLLVVAHFVTTQVESELRLDRPVPCRRGA